MDLLPRGPLFSTVSPVATVLLRILLNVATLGKDRLQIQRILLGCKCRREREK